MLKIMQQLNAAAYWRKRAQLWHSGPNRVFCLTHARHAIENARMYREIREHVTGTGEIS